MEIALFIQNLQEERAEVALFIFTKQSAGASFNLTALRTNKRFGNNQRNLVCKLCNSADLLNPSKKDSVKLTGLSRKFLLGRM